METIREINTEIEEGQLLIVALGRLSCMPGYTDKSPDEVLHEVDKVAKEIFKNKHE